MISKMKGTFVERPKKKRSDDDEKPEKKKKKRSEARYEIMNLVTWFDWSVVSFQVIQQFNIRISRPAGDGKYIEQIC